MHQVSALLGDADTRDDIILLILLNILIGTAHAHVRRSARVAHKHCGEIK